MRIAWFEGMKLGTVLDQPALIKFLQDNPDALSKACFGGIEGAVFLIHDSSGALGVEDPEKTDILEAGQEPD